MEYIFQHEFTEGLSAVKIMGKDGEYTYGFIDEKGVQVISFNKYFDVRPFKDGLALVHEIWVGQGFIDKTGKEVIPLTFGTVMEFSCGLAAVAGHQPSNSHDLKGGGYIDKQGKVVIPLKYDLNDVFSEGFAAVGMGGDVLVRRG